MWRHTAGWILPLILPLILLTLVGGGCTEAPIDVEGLYTIALTNRENGCNFNDWQEGTTSTGVQVTVTQSSASAWAFVGGASGVWLNVTLGSQEYSGSVNGNDVHMTLYGTRSTTVAGCTWTINSVMDGTLTGDTLSGDIRYTPSTNGSPDCATIEGCVTRQEFNGVRAPR